MLIVAVVHRAGHERPVGIAFDELDHHFHADARNELAAPLLARPDFGDANAARLLLLSVPEELDQDAAVFVDVDLLTLLADHLGGLNAVDERLRRDDGSAENLVLLRQELEISRIVLLRGPAARTVVLGYVEMRTADHQVVLVLRGLVVALELGRAARKQ